MYRIIPSKAGKMAGISVDLMVGKLIDVKKVFQRLDPNKMAQALKPGMQKTMRQVVDNAARYQMPKAWNSMPQKVKDDFCLKLLDSVPDFFESLLEDVPSYSSANVLEDSRGVATWRSALAPGWVTAP